MADLSERLIRERLRHLEEKVYPDSQDTPPIEFGSEDSPLPPGHFESLYANHQWFGQQPDSPSDSEIGEGNVAVYAKDGGELYTRQYGGTERQVGQSAAGYDTVAPLGSELQSGYALTMGVPVPDGDTIEIISWGVRTSEGTTPSGLTAQLTEVDGTVIAEENTAYSEPDVSRQNTSGGIKWYHLRISNSTGTDYVDGSTPDAVNGNFVYDIV